MTYAHFDRDTVRGAMQRAADNSLEQGLLEAKSEEDRAYIRAQHQFSAVVAEAFALCIDFKNAGKSSQFIGSVVGSAFGTLISNLALNVEDPAACLDRINLALNRYLEHTLVQRRSDFTSTNGVSVKGEIGGRA